MADVCNPPANFRHPAQNMHPIHAHAPTPCHFSAKYPRKQGADAIRAPPLHRVTQTIPQKGADQQIRSAPSIDSRYSTTTSYKSDTPVSGGAYQDIRKVTTEWNARPKHWGLLKFRCRMHPTVTKRPFSPPSFPARRKRRGRRRQPAVANL